MMIKKCLALLCVAAMASVANANLVQNGDFDAGDVDWGYQSAWGNFFYTDGPDTITSMGGWGNNVDWTNTSVFQDTGSVFAANTLYTMEVVWRSPSTDALLDNVRLVIEDTTSGTGWTGVASGIYTTAVQDVWVTSTLTFDTASNPGVVGEGIGVSFQLTSGTGTWVHVDSVALTIPEPATISCLLVAAPLGLLRRRRS